MRTSYVGFGNPIRPRVTIEKHGGLEPFSLREKVAEGRMRAAPS